MTTYNGWTNYATWRVNLEMFDGINPHDCFSEAVDGEGDVAKLAGFLKDYAEDYIYCSTDAGLARRYALDFISDVNWHEIAERMVADYCEEEKGVCDE